MKKRLLVFLCAILCSTALYSQDRTSWDMAGITFPLVPGMVVTASSDAVFTAKGNGIVFRIKTIGDVNSNVVSVLTARAGAVEKDIEAGRAPIPESVPEVFYEYLQERGYRPAGSSREVFMPFDYGIVGYAAQCADDECRVLAGVFYVRHRQLPLFVVVRFPESRAKEVGDMLMQVSTVQQLNN